MGRLSPTTEAEVVQLHGANGPGLDEVGLAAWIAQAEPGEALVYHRGFLAVDATSVISKLPPDRQRTLQLVAAAARRAAEQNLVHLVAVAARSRRLRLHRRRPPEARPARRRALDAPARGRLTPTRNGALGAGQAVQGIEFDALGRRRAYWLFGVHPGDVTLSLTGGLTSRAVPATEIAHVYEKQRTQARGVPWGAPVIRALRDLDDYEVAEIVRKKTEACVTAIVFGDEEAQQGIAPAVVDADGNRVEQFEPGLIAYARGGKDIRFNQPAATGGYGEYKRCTTVATDNTLIGVAVDAVAGGAGDTIGRVRLNGSF